MNSIGTSLRPIFIQTSKMLATVSLVWIATGFGFQCWFSHSATVDYSTRPPAKVFNNVLGQDIPTGVSDLKVAGRGLRIGHMVWMKYSATDSAMNTLLKNKVLLLDGPYNSLIWATRKQVLQDMDAQSIGWNSVLQSRHLEYYRYSSVSTGSGWIGEVVLDRRNHMVYTYSSAI